MREHEFPLCHGRGGSGQGRLDPTELLFGRYSGTRCGIPAPLERGDGVAQLPSDALLLSRRGGELLGGASFGGISGFVRRHNTRFRLRNLRALRVDEPLRLAQVVRVRFEVL